MLCCGIVAFIIAVLAGFWRRLRNVPRFVLIGGGAALLAIPVAVLASAEQPRPFGLSRENVLVQAMQSICG